MVSRLDNAKGIWFFGLAGSGKTTASGRIKKKVEHPFLIDGDTVRQLVSCDLSYTKKDREVQIQRVLGISQLAALNGYFPISSTVFMNQYILELAEKAEILVVQITRSSKQITSIRELYQMATEDVVGVSIPQPKLKTTIIHNCGTSNFFINVDNI